MSSIKNQASSLKGDAVDRAKAAQSAGITNPIVALHRAGFRSEWAYVGGFASIALSFIAWLGSRARPDHDRAQSDRWGIFVGHWAPTFFALGIALKQEEK